MEKVFKFEELEVYQKSLEFVNHAYGITKKLPKEERYGLSSQFQRAALSVSLNIAEGAGDTDTQFHRFPNISKGSIRECVVCATISNRLGYISKQQNLIMRQKLLEQIKMISGLQKYLRSND
ncbi:four helix bundle protein [Flavobacteriaceae bacterium TK19130]|nr:four helix bundle protein [Thermobacterium salinum]